MKLQSFTIIAPRGNHFQRIIIPTALKLQANFSMKENDDSCVKMTSIFKSS